MIQSGRVPASWRALKGERLEGAEQITSFPQPLIRTANSAVHCGTPMHFGPDPDKWHCKKTPDGTVIDTIVEQGSGRLVEGAKWDYCLVVLNRQGKIIDAWQQYNHLFGHPHHIMISPYNNKILKYTFDGRLVNSWGTFGTRPGNIWGVHYFNTDSDGNFYTAEVFGGRVQKFRPRAGVDPARLVGPLSSPGIQ